MTYKKKIGAYTIYLQEIRGNFSSEEDQKEENICGTNYLCLYHSEV